MLLCDSCSHAFSDATTIFHPERYGPEYYEDIHRKWFANPNLELFGRIASYLPESMGAILDVGCGKGAFLRYLRALRGDRLRLVGVDISSNPPEGGIEFWQGEFSEMPGEERFDAVVSLAVIEHVGDPGEFAAKLAKRCARGGLVVIMTLDNDSLLYATARLLARFGFAGPARRLYSAHHLQHFTGRSLRMALEKAGLQVIDICHHNAPLASIDVPASNAIARAVFTVGVIGLFWLGTLTGRTYLQTMVARQRED